MTVAQVRLVNPLPAALRHYERALRETLEDAGIACLPAPFPGIELAADSRAARLRRATAVVLRQRRYALTSDPVLATWPVFGLADLAAWSIPPSPRAVDVVLHDPRPLHPGPGYGHLAGVLARHGPRRRGTFIVHSSRALVSVRQQGLPEPTLLPHPLRRVTPPPPDTRQRRVLVAGQYKPTRNTELMQLLTPLLAKAGIEARIVGRGWPSLPGWEQRDEFLAEEALDAELDSAGCLLLPYTAWFQSGMVLRALERGCPVALPRVPEVEAVTGSHWQGFVDGESPDNWLRAVTDAMSAAPDIAASSDRYRLLCTAEWESHIRAHAR